MKVLRSCSGHRAIRFRTHRSPKRTGRIVGFFPEQLFPDSPDINPTAGPARRCSRDRCPERADSTQVRTRISEYAFPVLYSRDRERKLFLPAGYKRVEIGPGSAIVQTMYRQKMRAIINFFSHGIWEIDVTKLTRVRRFFVRRIRLSVFVFKGFFDDDCLLRATALTYTTLLSVVPILTIGFSIFAAVGKLESITDRLRTYLMSLLNPSRVETITRSLNEYMNNIRTAEINVVAFVFLILAAVGLVSSIEKSFNDIWGVKKGRSTVQKFIIYWCLLTLCPVLLGISLAFTGAVSASVQNSQIHRYFNDIPLVGHVIVSSHTIFKNLFQFAVPLLLNWTALTMLYLYMPNTKVRFLPAFTGAIISGSVFEIAKRIYTWHIGGMIAASPINKAYGALSAVPIFLIWIYMVWLIVLFGAEISYSAQNIGTYILRKRIGNLSQRVKELLGLRTTLACCARFRSSDPPYTVDMLCEEFKVPVHLLNEVLESLVKGRILVDDTSQRRQLFPAREPAAITVKDVLNAMRKRGTPLLGLHRNQEQKLLEDVVARGERASETVYREENFARLADRIREGRTET